MPLIYTGCMCPNPQHGVQSQALSVCSAFFHRDAFCTFSLLEACTDCCVRPLCNSELTGLPAQKLQKMPLRGRPCNFVSLFIKGNPDPQRVGASGVSVILTGWRQLLTSTLAQKQLPITPNCPLFLMASSLCLAQPSHLRMV